jgi:hypothetical protein
MARDLEARPMASKDDKSPDFDEYDGFGEDELFHIEDDGAPEVSPPLDEPFDASSDDSDDEYFLLEDDELDFGEDPPEVQAEDGAESPVAHQGIEVDEEEFLLEDDDAETAGFHGGSVSIEGGLDDSFLSPESDVISMGGSFDATAPDWDAELDSGEMPDASPAAPMSEWEEPLELNDLEELDVSSADVSPLAEEETFAEFDSLRLQAESSPDAEIPLEEDAPKSQEGEDLLEFGGGRRLHAR